MAGSAVPAARELPLRRAEVDLPPRLHPDLRGQHPAEDRVRRVHDGLRGDHRRHRGRGIRAAGARHGEPGLRGHARADRPGDLPARDGAHPARVGPARDDLQHHGRAAVRDLRGARRHRLPHRRLGREPPDAAALRRPGHRGRRRRRRQRGAAPGRGPASAPGGRRGEQGRRLHPRRVTRLRRRGGPRAGPRRHRPGRAGWAVRLGGGPQRLWQVHAALAGGGAPAAVERHRAVRRRAHDGAGAAEGGHGVPGGEPAAVAVRHRQRRLPAEAPPGGQGRAARGGRPHARADGARGLQGSAAPPALRGA